MLGATPPSLTVTKNTKKQPRRLSMPVKNPREIFVLMLSDLRQGSEKTTKIFQDLTQLAEDPDIKQALEARIFVSQKVAETLDQCFKLIGEQPMKLSGTRTRIYDALAEDFRKEVADIQDTKTRRFYILAKLNNLVHLRAAEYKTLIAAADISGNYGVATLLETCLADKLALAERTQHWLRRIAETEMAEKIGAKRAA
jgi:ferritin-like metal-binding protein YciE